MSEPHSPSADSAKYRATLAYTRREIPWAQRYAGKLIYGDIAAVATTLTAFGLIFVRNKTLVWPSGPELPYVVPLGLIGIMWLLCLDGFESRDRHIVGDGVLEYRRVISATGFLFALVISIAFFFRIDISRLIFILAIPFGLLLLLLGRWGWRQWLRKRQSKGLYVYRAVVVGEKAKVAHVVRAMRRARDYGYVITGAITPSGAPATIGDVPVLGSLQNTMEAMATAGADTLILAGSDDLDPDTMRRLGWSVADHNMNWVVAPALTDIAGPRIHARPVAGLPLVHVDFPRLEGYRRVVKRTFDIVGSALVLLLVSPILGYTACRIRREGPGPILYRQDRIGRHGQTFSMLKFRSMVVGADDQLKGLLDLQGTGAQPFQKVNNDPRVTKAGAFMRRHSIDELPQLINVLRGHMSLVGPRPQRADEVKLYNNGTERRLLVKPGMSGLWQVSGRSSLSAEDSIRLDLYYVENWSFAQDIQILFRTFKAVLRPGTTAG
ncbi:sugar transferase [Microbacterium sp. NC79]|uniref:sugar transferase n=1 Tax=Microbacterium sp. NC79 TaxID=2851009 RepID=UPI001C2CBC66|nr:sugar transferase [Microbacterium sp. NC79]MBV0894063.1 sugar transferase [Microbacterium sp. NC79]